MTPERWQQVERLFEQALETPAAERPQFLKLAHDEELRAEVEAMLRAHESPLLDEPGNFFSGDDWTENQFQPGERIERYRIVREIGRGGMGTVFLAERADEQFRKQVALKVIKRGMDSDSVLRRFRNERQILASFDHPNIARLLDGGTTASGLPYFAMEYVEGLPIDEYCNLHALSLTEQLKLFREVCAAISYAHRRLVIHRDLKRSNILVTKEGVAKLLDFGIAKILQEGNEPLATVTGARPMTPEWASPEQLNGQPVTTATDVYSLGLVLYELLTGQFPYRFVNQSPRDIERAITEQEPTRPSTVVRSATQENSARSRHDARAFRGDLDNIVLMALRKEPERRYSSVEQFSEDIRRHLEARPVLARRDTAGYRAAKFVQRNRVATVAAALLLCSLLGGITATTIETRRARSQEAVAQAEKARAERRFNDVRRLANSVLFDYHDAIKSLPGATKVRERLAKDALSYLDSLASDAHDDPALQRELAAAYERVGDVRGGDTNGNFNDVSGAAESYTKALRIREALVARSPGDVQARRDLARNHRELGASQLKTKEANSSLEHLRQAKNLYSDLNQEQPANEALQLEFATASNQLGVALIDHRDVAGAMQEYRAALAICEKLVASHPQEQQFRRALWSSYEGVANALFLQRDNAGAAEANAQALALGEALIAEAPLNSDYRRVLVLNYQNGGDYRSQSDKKGALDDFRRAAELDEQLVTADPANALTRKDLASTYKRMADLLANAGDNAQALLHFRQAREISEKLVADAPADLTSHFRVVLSGAGAAGMEARLGDVEAALQEAAKALAFLQQIPDDPNNVRPRYSRGESYEYLGYAYSALADSPKASASEKVQYRASAREMFQQCLNIIQDLRSRGALDENNSTGWAKTVASELAKCDKALAR